MNLEKQRPHDKACKQACIAMLADKTLAQVIADAGTDQPLDLTTRHKLHKLYGLNTPEFSFAVGAFAEHSLAELMRKHSTLLCSVLSYADPHFSHAVVIHEKQMYDPWHGMNPTWSWDRVIAMATPIVRK